MTVLAEPEQHHVEDDVAELAAVRGGRLDRPELAAHPVDDGARRPQRLAHHPRVGVGIVGTDAALVREPDVRTLPVLHERAEQLVGALGRAPAGEGDVGGPARAQRLLDAGRELVRRALGGRLGIGLAQQLPHGSCAGLSTCECSATHSSSAAISFITALISARCVKACGKLPRWRPVVASISSAYRASGEA